jgi:hypothetical protein
MGARCAGPRNIVRSGGLLFSRWYGLCGGAAADAGRTAAPKARPAAVRVTAMRRPATTARRAGTNLCPCANTSAMAFTAAPLASPPISAPARPPQIRPGRTIEIRISHLLNSMTLIWTSTGKLNLMRPFRQVAGGTAVAFSSLILAACSSGTAAVSAHNSWRSATALASAATRAPDPNEVPPSHASHQPRGVVHGQVVRRPGLDPRSGSGSGSLVPVNGDPVEVRDLRGRVVAAIVTNSGGFFSIAIPPGEYRVVEDICGVSKQINIRNGLAIHVILTIPNAC